MKILCIKFVLQHGSSLVQPGTVPLLFSRKNQIGNQNQTKIVNISLV